MTANTEATAVAVKKKRTFLEVVHALRQPKILAMLALGFSSGLPFMMFGNTLGFWLADGKVALATIGFISWTGLVFLFKFIWGAIVDNIPVPVLARLGRRRSWLLVTQSLVAIGLVGMALSGPAHLYALAASAVVTAFGSAMQDTVVDAWRIEIADHPDELGMLTAVYSLGYRVALFASEALILAMAEFIGWPACYAIFGGAMIIGMAAAIFCREPARNIERVTFEADVLARGPVAVLDAVTQPFIAFFKTHGVALAALSLGMITLYHLCDYMRGPMGAPYYKELGIDKLTIAAVRGGLGVPFNMLGVAVGGVVSLRFGRQATLLIGAILQPIAIASFALLAAHGSDYALVSVGGYEISAFATIMSLDAFCIAFSGVALIAYMSSLTSIGYTATQYALMTSAMAWSGKIMKGFSGEIVDGLKGGRTAMEAYGLYYLGCGLIGIPAIILCIVLVARHRRELARARLGAAPA